MKLIVGLGNPGRAYENSRHNAGFLVINALAKAYKVCLKKEKNANALVGSLDIDGDRVLFVMPLTFMNLSGMAVAALIRKHKIALEDLLVICDDLDLELGRIKIRSKGSSGGHNGLKSIMDHLGTQDFARLRIGINRPDFSRDTSDYVLSRFASHDIKQISEAIEKSCDCVISWLTQGVDKTMNKFNMTKRSSNNE